MAIREEGPLADRATYKAYHTVSTRWADNDQYGHINNAKFYEFVDSAVNAHLIIADALSDSIGLVVDSGCRYTSSLAFPDVIEVGIKVDHIGTSSVKYGFAVFPPRRQRSRRNRPFRSRLCRRRDPPAQALAAQAQGGRG
jgi:acyl-CoA thioester hydrolase